MAIRFHTIIEFEDIPEGVKGTMSAGVCYKLVKQFMQLKGFVRAVVTPVEGGEAIKGAGFVVEKGDDVRAKFHGWYYPNLKGSG